MKRPIALVSLAVAVVAVVAGAGIATGQSLYGKYLTVADVEKATGLSRLAGREVAITLEFYDAKGTKIVDVRFDRPSSWDQEVERNKSLYETVPGIGEKAAIAIPAMPYRVTLVKGNYCVMIQSVPVNGKVPLTKDQLLALARVVASRL